MWPPVPVHRIVINYPVAALDDRRPYRNRRKRRSMKYGRQHVFDRIAGRMSPKQMREAGLL